MFCGLPSSGGPQPSVRVRAGVHPRSPSSLLVANTRCVAKRRSRPAFVPAQAL